MKKIIQGVVNKLSMVVDKLNTATMIVAIIVFVSAAANLIFRAALGHYYLQIVITSIIFGLAVLVALLYGVITVLHHRAGKSIKYVLPALGWLVAAILFGLQNL